MANFTAGTSFSDGVTNDVTAAKLNALVADAVPTSNLALTSTNGTISNFTSSTANITLGTIPTLTAGTTTGTAGIFTSGTITTGLIPTLTTGTTTGTAGIFTSGTITTGLIPTLTTGTTTSTNEVVTNGTITNLSATTSTFLGTITGSTNVVNIGSGQIYKDASGNVGIGTTSPAAKLHVYSASASDKLVRFGPGGLSDVNFITTAKNGVSGSTNGTPQFSLGMDYSTTYEDLASIKFARGAGAQGNILFFTGDQANGAERLRIDSSGNLLVGTTAQGGSALITARSGANRTAGFFDVNVVSSSATPALVLQKFTNDSTTAQVLMQFIMNNGSNGAGQINGNGANAAAFGTYSDSRLKENITALPSQIDNVCALKPCEFDYKDGSGHQIGFIAQEIQEVYPDCVGDRGDGMLTVTGWSKTEARLVKAIQELKAKNDSLEARLQALEAA
jgi:hypothetical protein